MQADKVCIFYFSKIYFSAFKRQRYWIVPYLRQGGPAGWLVKKKSSSLRSGIFSCQALTQKDNPKAGGL